MSAQRTIAGFVRRPQQLTGTVLGALCAVAVLIASWMVTTSTPPSEVRVRLSDGAVWLASVPLGGVSLLDGGSGSIATSLQVAGNNDELEVVQWASDAIIVNRSDGTVSRLDGAAWEIETGRVKFGNPGEALSVVAGHDVGWLVQAGTVSVLDLETLTQANPSPIGASFSDGIVTEKGDLLYASDDTTAPVRRFPFDGSDPVDVDGLTGPTALADLGSVEAAVDLDDHSVWIADRGTVCDRLEVAADAELRAGGADEHLMVVSSDGGVFLWDPSQSGCPTNDDFVALGSGNYGRPVLTDGWGVVQDIGSGEVVVIDFDALDDVRRSPLEGVQPGTAVQLIAENGAVWYNDPRSSKAGLIQRDGTTLPVTKYDEGGSDGFVVAPLGEGDEAALAVAGTEQSADTPDPAVDQAPIANQTEPTTPPAGPEVTQPPTNTAPEQPTATTQPNGPGGTQPVVGPGEGGSTTTIPGTTTTVPDQPLKIQIGASATQVAAGGTLQFTSLTVNGRPNFWELQVSPNTGRQAPYRIFGTFEYTFYDVGRYVVAIEACDPQGNCDTPRIAVDVVANPDLIELRAAFTAPATARVGDPVQLTDASQGDPGGWRWQLDGASPATSSDQNPTATWSTPGTKTVTLTASRGSETDVATRTIVVEPATTDPSPFDLTCGPTTLAAGETSSCSMVGDPADFSGLSWSATVPSPGTATYGPTGPTGYAVQSTVAGTASVTLRGTDRGTGDPVTKTVTITFTDSPPVTAGVLPSGTIGGPGSLQVNTNGSYQLTGQDYDSIAWSAQGNPTISSPASANTSIRWTTPGTYEVSATLTGAGTYTARRTVTVTAATPTVTFNPTCGPTSRPANGTSAATCRLTDGNASEFSSLSFSVSNPSGLSLNQWGSPGESYVASFDPGTVTINASATHIASGTPVTGGPWTITFTAAATPSPFGLSCNASTLVGDGSEIAWCTLQGDPANFAGLNYAITAPNPSALNTWGSPVGWNIGYSAVGTVTVTLTGTDNATGQPVSATRSLSFVAPATTTTTTTTTPTTTTTAGPTPSPFGISCSGPHTAGSVASCSLSGDPANFSGINWASGPDNPSALQWWPSGATMSFQYDEVGGVNVTLSATDLATGSPVSASTRVNFG